MDYEWIRGRLAYIDDQEILTVVLEEIINELERLNKRIQELEAVQDESS